MEENLDYGKNLANISIDSSDQILLGIILQITVLKEKCFVIELSANMENKIIIKLQREVSNSLEEAKEWAIFLMEFKNFKREE